MSELAVSECEILLFYDPNAPIGAESLGYAKGEGYALRDFDILKNKFTGMQFEDIADRLHVPIDGLVNKDHPDFERYKDDSFSDDDWIKILQKNPQLIKQPIAIRGHQAIFVKTPSDLSRL